MKRKVEGNRREKTLYAEEQIFKNYNRLLVRKYESQKMMSHIFKLLEVEGGGNLCEAEFHIQ